MMPIARGIHSVEFVSSASGKCNSGSAPVMLKYGLMIQLKDLTNGMAVFLHKLLCYESG